MSKQNLPYWLTIVPPEQQERAGNIIAMREAEFTAIVPYVEYGNVDAIRVLQKAGILTDITEEELDAIHELGEAGEINGHEKSVDDQVNEQIAASLADL